MQPWSRKRWMSMSASSFPSFYSDLDPSPGDGAISIQGMSSLLGMPAQTHPECLLGDSRASSADNEEELSQEHCTIFGINVYIKQIPIESPDHLSAREDTAKQCSLLGQWGNSLDEMACTMHWTIWVQSPEPMWEGENWLPKVVLLPSHMHHDTCTCTQEHTYTHYIWTHYIYIHTLFKQYTHNTHYIHTQYI